MTRKKTDPGSRLTEEIAQLLANLHLRRIAECFDEEVRRAEDEGTTFPEIFVRLLRAQYHFRQESAQALGRSDPGLLARRDPPTMCGCAVRVHVGTVVDGSVLTFE